MFSNREGVNIDSVSRPISQVFNYKTTLPIALGLSLEPILARWAPSLLQKLLQNETFAKFLHLAAEHAGFRRPACIAAALTAAYAFNSYLSHKAANNWVEDGTYDFDREIVLITGGSNGIGASVAQEFLRRNRRTRIVIVDFVELKWTPPAGSHVHFYQCDLSDAAAVEAMGRKVREEVGHPTVLLNNAGVARAAPIVAASAEDQAAVVKTNLLGQLFVTKEFLPEMIRRDHGHVVYSSSMSSVFPMPMLAAYSTTKAALSALHDVSRFFYGTCRPPCIPLGGRCCIILLLPNPVLLQRRFKWNSCSSIMHLVSVRPSASLASSAHPWLVLTPMAAS